MSIDTCEKALQFHRFVPTAVHAARGAGDGMVSLSMSRFILAACNIPGVLPWCSTTLVHFLAVIVLVLLMLDVFEGYGGHRLTSIYISPSFSEHGCAVSCGQSIEVFFIRLSGFFVGKTPEVSWHPSLLSC